MSSFQSWLQRLRDRQFNAAQLRQEIQAGDWLNRSLWVGLVLGLFLGLWIGWGLWPVQWENASLGDLSEDAKADYLAAVSDAYVIYSSPEAAAVAQQRLSALGSPDLAKDFSAAITYYNQSNAPDKAMRVSNLSRLASALGLTGPVITTASQATPLNVLIQPQATVNPAGVSVSVGITNSAQTNAAGNASAASGSWLNGILGLLIALMVIAAIFYLYLSIRPAPARYPPSPSDEPLDDDTINAEFDKMSDASVTRRAQMYGTPDTQGAPKSTYTSPARGNRPGSTWTSGSWTSAAAPTPARRTERDEYEFDDESDDEATGPRYTTAQRYQPDQPTHRPPVWEEQSARNAEEDEYPTEDDESDWDDEEDLDEGGGVNATAEPPAPPSGSQRPTANVAITDAPSLRRDPPAEPSPAPSPTTPAAARAGVAGRSSRLKLLEKYTAQYQAGIANYDEAHQILDPSTNKYIGEIGMGVSTKNALLQNDPDQVIALEVWLFDKADERNIGNQTRILLSEYAVDHNLEQAFLKERQDDPRPFTAQPGVRFQLEGHSLRLDCEIIEATYTKSGSGKGIFQSVKVEMTVLQKT